MERASTSGLKANALRCILNSIDLNVEASQDWYVLHFMGVTFDCGVQLHPWDQSDLHSSLLGRRRGSLDHGACVMYPMTQPNYGTYSDITERLARSLSASLWMHRVE